MLELKNLCFGVENEDSAKEIIKDVSFVVPDEKFVVITGPNGGGKSTLARLIMGIEKPLVIRSPRNINSSICSSRLSSLMSLRTAPLLSPAKS